MPASKPLGRMVSHVILDLDGTLLNTDGIVNEIMKVVLVKYGKNWDKRGAQRIIGKTPMEAVTAIVEDYELPCRIDDFVSTITPMFNDQWCNIKALPGANRLINHLRSKGVPMALASNSPKSNIETKISYHHGWKECFSVIIGGDEVQNGKPSPEIFLEAAKRMNADPSNCLVIEDSLPGVTAGKEAGMEVVAVPSLPKQAGLYSSADEVINSLLDLHPEKWGLPPFEDWVEETLPIEPWYIGGPVIKGFGRGSKVLGIPTALWWESYGDECKELQVLAIGILSLTCSATECERNWSVFDYLHSKRRNRLEQLKLNALVFVKYNLQLEMRQKMREAKGDTYDPICLSDMDSDDEWITEKKDACLPDDNNWMDIQEYFELEEGTSGPKKKKGKKRANLPAENFSDVLSEHTSGVYFGWASLLTHGIYKMVMSIGWNPYFDNTEKTIEPWLLHEFEYDFYGEELRLVIVGYIRPEANFPSLNSLIERIHEDGRIAEKALDLPIYAGYKDSPYLKSSNDHR